MPTPLEKTLQELASNFAEHVLEALRGLSLDEILSATAGSGKRPASKPQPARHRSKRGAAPRANSGRLARRSDADIGEVVDRIVTVLKKHKGGLRAERLREALAIPRKELQRPIAFALTP